VSVRRDDEDYPGERYQSLVDEDRADRDEVEDAGPRGRCDTCGAPVGEEGCTADDGHEVAIDVADLLVPPAPTWQLEWIEDARTWIVRLSAPPETDVIVTLNGRNLS
jgi:hypothetical protein